MDLSVIVCDIFIAILFFDFKHISRSWENFTVLMAILNNFYSLALLLVYQSRSSILQVIVCVKLKFAAVRNS